MNHSQKLGCAPIKGCNSNLSWHCHLVIERCWCVRKHWSFLCVCLCACYVPGEVPGLYTPEELEPLLTSLKDAASQDGFTGPLYNYFSYSQFSIFINITVPLSFYVLFIILDFSHLCGTLIFFLTVKVCYMFHFFLLIVLFVLPCYCIWLCSSASPLCSGVCVYCGCGAVLLRFRFLLENQINSSIIVKVNPLKSLPTHLHYQSLSGRYKLKGTI